MPEKTQADDEKCLGCGLPASRRDLCDRWDCPYLIFKSDQRDDGLLHITKRERIALRSAAAEFSGWGLFNPKTTAALAARGFFVKEKHPNYGMQWRITGAGRAALAGTDRDETAEQQFVHNQGAVEEALMEVRRRVSEKIRNERDGA